MKDQQEAIVMTEQGMDIPSIAKELNVPVAQVYRWLSSTELMKRQRQRRNELICKAYKEGWLIHRVCTQFSVSKGTLYTVLRQSSVTLRRDAKDIDDDIVAKMYVDGALVGDIVDVAGCSLAHIYRVLAERQIPKRRILVTHPPPLPPHRATLE